VPYGIVERVAELHSCPRTSLVEIVAVPEGADHSLEARTATTHLGSSRTDVARAPGVSRQSAVAARGRGHQLTTERGLDWQTLFGYAGPV